MPLPTTTDWAAILANPPAPDYSNLTPEQKAAMLIQTIPPERLQQLLTMGEDVRKRAGDAAAGIFYARSFLLLARSIFGFVV